MRDWSATGVLPKYQNCRFGLGILITALFAHVFMSHHFLYPSRCKLTSYIHPSKETGPNVLLSRNGITSLTHMAKLATQLCC